MNLSTNQKFKMQFISPTTFFLWGVPFIYLFLNATASSSFFRSHLHSIAFALFLKVSSPRDFGAQGSAGSKSESYLYSKQPPLQVVNQRLMLSRRKAGRHNQNNKSFHFCVNWVS